MSRGNVRRRRTLREIDKEVERLFDRLKLNDVLPICWFAFLMERLPSILQGFKVISVNSFKHGLNAQAHSKSNSIRLSNHVWLAAQRGDPHARTIFFHELGHLVLNHEGVNPDVTDRDVRHIRDETSRLNEWEAKRFAAAMQIPAHLIFGTPSERELQQRFGVGAETARIRMEDLKFDSEKAAAGPRPIPGRVQQKIDEIHSQSAPTKSEPSQRVISRGKHYSVERKITLRRAFVSMPLRTETNVLYDQIIRRALSSCGLVPVRGDHSSRPGSIISQIIESISICELFLAEVSGLNPNVMHEIGMAQILGIEPILLCRRETELPFNIRHLRCIFYENAVAVGPALTEEIARAVRAAITKL